MKPATNTAHQTEHTTGAELQTLREAAGLSRDSLAELVGVQARTVKHWENGRSGVPADVAAVVHNLAQWVNMNARNMHAIARRQALGTPSATRTTYDEDGEPASIEIAPAEPARPVVLLRYKHTADMMPGDQEQGAQADCHGAAVGQVVQRLALDGVAARVVWFDPASFASWCQKTQADDTPAARQAWAEREALPAQAVPARGDQPPANYTGTP